MTIERDMKVIKPSLERKLSTDTAFQLVETRRQALGARRTEVVIASFPAQEARQIML